MADDIYPERFCAFIDILGFRGLVARLGKDAGAVESLRKVLREVHKPKIPGLADPASVDYRTQSISDAVAISTVPTPEGLMMLIGSLNQLTFNLLLEGYFVRGAIVRGCLYHDDEMIFGEALVRAYDLETTVVKYPRIMVHTPVLNSLPAGVPADSCKSNFRPSEDGPMYLHVLSRMNYDLEVMADRPDIDPTTDQKYNDIRDKLYRRYLDAIDNPAHFEKAKWFARYWNETLPRKRYQEMRVRGPGLDPAPAVWGE
jgi:hypothetical protein